MLSSSRGIVFFLATTCSVACVDAGSFFTPPPEATSLVLAVEVNGQIAIEAYDIDRAPALIYEDPSSIEAWVYDVPLQELRIPSGPLLRTPSGTRLPPPRDRYFLALTDEPPTWQVSTSSPILGDARIERTSRCTEFEIQRIPLSIGRTEFMEALPDGRALHGFHHRGQAERLELQAVSRDGSIETLGVFEGPGPHAAQIFEDRIWYGGEEGRVGSAPVDDLIQVTHTATIPSQGEILSIAVGAIDGGAEIFVVDDHGSLARLSNGQVEALAPPLSVSASDAVVTRTGAGEVYTALETMPFVRHFVDGRQFDEPLEGASRIPIVVASTGNAGLVAGSDFGSVFRREAGLWKLFIDTDWGIQISSIVDFRDRLLIGGEGGSLAEWVEGEGLCPPVAVDGGFRVEEILVFEDYVLVGNRPATNDIPADLWVLRPLP